MGYRDYHAEAASKISPIIKQEYLDYLKEGMTIGEACEKAGISLDAALGIVNEQIKSVHYFDFEANQKGDNDE